MDPATTAVRLHLKRDERLEIDFQDGRQCVYSIEYLRQMCPCATCKAVRVGTSETAEPAAPKPKKSLTILPGNYAQKLTAESAQLVGNYAIRIDWSDQHASGIYSFVYLRSICPSAASSSAAP